MSFGTRVCENKNENGPRGLIYLNVWTTVSGTIWEGLADVALLAECALQMKVDHRGWALRYQKFRPFPVSANSLPHYPIPALCLWVRCKMSTTAPEPCSLSAMLPFMMIMNSTTLRNHEPQIKCFHLYAALNMVPLHSNRKKITKTESNTSKSKN